MTAEQLTETARAVGYQAWARRGRSLATLGLEPGDLVHEAALAMLEAAPRFRPEVGASERTFLGRRAAGAVVDLERREIHRGGCRTRSTGAPPRLELLDDRLGSGDRRVAAALADGLGVGLAARRLGITQHQARRSRRRVALALGWRDEGCGTFG